jgi:hypothetical protein
MTRPQQVSVGAAAVAQHMAQARRAVPEVRHQLSGSPQELEAAAKRYEEILVAVREGFTDPFRPAPGTGGAVHAPLERLGEPRRVGQQPTQVMSRRRNEVKASAVSVATITVKVIAESAKVVRL